MNSPANEGSEQVNIGPTDEKRRVRKADHQSPPKKNGRSCFEWIQLVATIWIPIVIAIYTVVENKSNESIATSNRQKDIDIANISRKLELEIAEANRWKDIEIANISRISEREIALAQRLNELDIAEQSRQKDRDLATDQQHQNILIEYQSFLAKLIIENGVDLSKNPGAKLAAHFMTRTALNQLDTTRRSILIRSLYDTNMITQKRTISNDQPSLIDLRQVDLSGIRFGLLTDFPDEAPKVYYSIWRYLWLPYTILRNTSLRYTTLDCASFTNAILDSSDLSFTRATNLKCFDNPREIDLGFPGASLVNTSWYKAAFRFNDFTNANLTLAKMQWFDCTECNFSFAILVKADLSSSRIFHTFTLYKGRLPFHNATLKQAVLHSSIYISINFDSSDWSSTQAQQLLIRDCTFTQATMQNCSFTQSIIRGSFFRKANLSMVDFTDVTLFNVTFSDADMRRANLSNIKCEYCDFTNALLDEAVLKNGTFIRSNFRGCRVSESQLEEAADLSGSTLPNGTVVRN